MPAIERHYCIDLAQPPEERWAGMIEAERENARTLIQSAVAEARAVADTRFMGGQLFDLARTFVPMVQDLYGGAYADDMKIWARGLGVARKDVVFANLIYEFTLLGNSLCTAFACDLQDGAGVAHVRNMDWPLTGIGPKSCLIEYRGPCGSFTTVGWPGYVGVLSGVAKGRFSASINQAPQIRVVRPAWPSSLLLRYCFESCTSWEECLETLQSTEIAAGTLFLVSGIHPGQAAVIEHGGVKGETRHMRHGAIEVANHYQTPRMAPYNEAVGMEALLSSMERGKLAGQMAKVLARRIKGLPEHLVCDGVCNDLTAQLMSFVPASGAFSAAYRNTDAAVARALDGLKTELTGKAETV